MALTKKQLSERKNFIGSSEAKIIAEEKTAQRERLRTSE